MCMSEGHISVAGADSGILRGGLAQEKEHWRSCTKIQVTSLSDFQKIFYYKPQYEMHFTSQSTKFMHSLLEKRTISHKKYSLAHMQCTLCFLFLFQSSCNSLISDSLNGSQSTIWKHYMKWLWPWESHFPFLSFSFPNYKTILMPNQSHCCSGSCPWLSTD